MISVSGYVEKIKYRNEENGYSVISISCAENTGISAKGEEVILVGNFAFIEEGEFISASGTVKNHPVYGPQISVEKYDIKEPEDIKSVEHYLSSGAVKGIGEALAARIVEHFQADTIRVMEEEPERLAEVKGISERMAMSFSEQIEEKKDMRNAMLFLTKYGISMNLAAKIYKQYGENLYTIIKENPYQLADDITGVGFKIADEIARRAGIEANSEYRIKCGFLYNLMQASGQGHMFLPEQQLLSRNSELLGIPSDGMREYLSDLQMDRKIILKKDPSEESAEEESHVYLSRFYYTELNTASMLHDLDIRSDEKPERILSVVSKMEQENGMQFDELQKKAVVEAARCGLLILTGGPGTGKTTTINAIIRYFEHEEMQILLAAPTGRAAKRMTEATGHEARTIHRLLEISGSPDREERNTNEFAGMYFARNEQMPLDADCVIIDEMSMVDIHLMYALLKAVSVGTHLILVGDVNQLPSVGPGNVLRDMIDSGCFNVVRLNQIYRQAAESDIIVNAHKMIRRERIDLSRRSRDFLFIRQDSPEDILKIMLKLLREKLPAYVHASVQEIQIMTPMRKGPLGVERLNGVLQNELNPHEPGKDEKELNGILFRTGDKVMQIRNDYHRGVYNGDIGIIKDINAFAETLTVDYDEGNTVEYSFTDAEELDLAYAITIHKSQGSEYPAVILPVWQGPRMLLTRNLIYTAVTRAKSLVALVGVPEYFYEMADNIQELRRNTGLKERIREIYS